jgi:hypothetical protein
LEVVATNGVARFIGALSEQSQWPPLAATMHLKIAVVYWISFYMAQKFKLFKMQIIKLFHFK